MKTKTSLIAALPWFPGFYESILDSFIDREIEQEMEGNGEDESSEYYRAPKTWEEVDEYANYSAAHQAIARAWVQEFSRETKIPMEFESMQSPREYNFSTDRVYVKLTPKTVAMLAKVRSTPEFDQVLEDWFTPRSGFMPFYSQYPESEKWQRPVREFDHNELSALIAAQVLVNGETETSLHATLYDRSNVYEAAQHVWDKLPEARAKKVAA